MSEFELPTIQGALASKQDALRRHLFDRNIVLTGHKYTTIQISEGDVDIYGDVLDGELEIELEKVVPMTINWPDDIPIDQFRISGDNSEERLQTENTSVFFYQVLPLLVYIPFTHNVHVGDYFILPTEDENGNLAFTIIKISEMAGKFSGGSITYRKYLASPEKGDIPQPILDLVQQMITRGIKWKNQELPSDSDSA